MRLTAPDMISPARLAGRGHNHRRPIRLWVLCATIVTVATACPGGAAQAALRVQIINDTGKPDQRIFVMLSGGSSSDGRIANNVPVKLSELATRGFVLDRLPGGRIMFSYDSPVNNAEPPRVPVRYDKVELSYPGVANLTAVDFFGIRFRLQTLDGRGQVRGMLGYSAPTATIVHSLVSIPGVRRALVKTTGGQFARVLSPQLSPNSYPSFRPYVGSMVGRRIVVRGAYFGIPFQTFVYSGRFDNAGSIALRGTITSGSGRPEEGETLSVNGAVLAPAIYTVDGPYLWGGATHHVSDNDVYAVIYRDLIAGFAWGYWGGRYGNDTRSWIGKPPFAAARREHTRYATYNPYAAVIYKYSNAYGFSFSDTGAKPVQLPLTAPMLQITILPDQRMHRR